MAEDLYYKSQGGGQIHYRKWVPQGKITAVLQIVHGIAEHIQRYDAFAQWLNSKGILVVGEDHMGHGASIGPEDTQGYFQGGWFAAVADSFRLMEITMEAYPKVPYILFGHSMGSFMVRTMLIQKPDCPINGAVICGTAWQPKALLCAAVPLSKMICKSSGERNPSPRLQSIMFDGYNSRIENNRTEYDWLTRDTAVVDAYIADPLCGFVSASGLLRDMLLGISFIENRNNLAKMNKDLPVLFVAGEEDPVGNYGKGVLRSAEEFQKAGMNGISCKLYPGMRHEILNEIGKEQVYADLLCWIEKITEAL